MTEALQMCPNPPARRRPRAGASVVHMAGTTGLRVGAVREDRPMMGGAPHPHPLPTAGEGSHPARTEARRPTVKRLAPASLGVGWKAGAAGRTRCVHA